MKQLKLMALFLSMALSTQLKAAVINQHFSPDFGGGWYDNTPVTDADGWSYVRLARETDARNAYYGASVSLQTYYYGNDPDAYLLTPAKTGGVGWITFWYKTHEVQSWNNDIITLEIQTSETGAGDDFTTVGTVSTPVAEAVWNRYSAVINDANAKFVRLLLKKGNSSTVTVDIDELVVTDAVSGGTPATIDAAVTANIESEGGIKATIANAITLSGANVTGNITLSFVASSSAFSVLPASVTGTEVNASIGLTVEFTPTVKNISSDYLRIIGDNIPEIFIRVNGLGLLRNIAEDFNTPMTANAYGNFDYYGWTVSGDANYTTTQYGPSADVYEGFGAVNFTSLISPKKVGGVGAISFMHRGYGSYTPDFEVYTSPDKITWTKVGNTTATSGTWTPFIITVNDPAAGYVKVATGSAKMDADAFIITENGAAIPSAVGTATSASGLTVPYTFNVPVTFANISDSVTLSIDEPQLTLGKTTLTQAEAAGTVDLPVTFTPAEGKAFARGTITISGGGLAFPATVVAIAYLEAEQLSIDFESEWSTSSGNQIVEGWNVTYGAKNKGSVEYPYGALGSPSSAGIQPGSSIISPPKSGGVGTVQFYAKVSYGTGTLGLSTSTDGTTWTLVEGADAIALKSDWQKFEYVINSASAKYIKITVTDGSYPNVDNITVTKNGVGIAAYTLLNNPVFMATSGEAQTVKLQLKGANITSDMQVALKSGTAFTLSNTTIGQNDINGKTYELPVRFYAESGSYFTDELQLSGGGLLFTETIPLKGYLLQDLIYQDFEGAIVHGTDYSSMNIDGWEAYASTATGANAYEGTSVELQPSSGSDTESNLLTVPKSGGVGEISFYYKNGSDNTYGYGNPVTFRIQTYKELGETPTVIVDTILPPSATNETPYQKFDRIVNDPDAKYVEVLCPKPDGTTGTLRIDNFAVSAVGKRVPEATAPSAIRMTAYPDETAAYSFDFTVMGVDKDIHLSMKNGNAVSVGKTAITPVNDQVAETITLTYDATGVTFSADTLVIESAGLLKSLVIPVLATTCQDVLVQDFEKEGWNMANEGMDILDGWVIKDGRNTWANYGETPLEGTNSLRLTSSVDVGGSITSPAKAGGIDKVEFYWRPQAASEAITAEIQTSIDGETWQTVDVLNTGTVTESSGYHLYEKTVGDKEAKYWRIQNSKTTYYRNISYLWIDSIAVTAMPYLRNPDKIQEIETSLSSCPIEVRVAGLLNSDARISLAEDADKFILATTSISPNALKNGAKAPVNLRFSANGAESGEYEARIEFTYNINDTVTETLTIPVLVKYTKPYIELVSIDGPETTTSGTAEITVKVKGVLNTDASITLERGIEFMLAQTSLTSAELAGETIVSFDVNFAASTFGIFSDAILIRNNDIETLTIPISIENKNKETGLDKISGGNISVYAGENGILNIVGAPAGSKVRVFDIQGKLIFSSTIQSANEQYNVLDKGVYVVKVNDKTWKVLR